MHHSLIGCPWDAQETEGLLWVATGLLFAWRGWGAEPTCGVNQEPGGEKLKIPCQFPENSAKALGSDRAGELPLIEHDPFSRSFDLCRIPNEARL